MPMALRSRWLTHRRRAYHRTWGATGLRRFRSNWKRTYLGIAVICTRAPLRHAVAREIIDDIRRDRLCRGDVGIAARCVALPDLGYSAPIKRARELRIEAQRRAVIVDGRIELAHLQVDQSA